MHESIKIREAEYFLNKMNQVKANYEEFVFNLSAFISAARSVAQYMHYETKSNGKLFWYENKTAKSDILKFFASTRDLNIHLRPYILQKNATVSVSALTLTAALATTSISSSGQVILSVPVSPSLPSVSAPTEVIHTYKFDPTWYEQIPVNEHFTQADKDLCMRICQQHDVITFCRAYIDELQTMANEGIVNQYLTS